ncbi:hypothetical protein ACMYSQ_012662 [Aspergillus niger]
MQSTLLEYISLSRVTSHPSEIVNQSNCPAITLSGGDLAVNLAPCCMRALGLARQGNWRLDFCRLLCSRRNLHHHTLVGVNCSLKHRREREHLSVLYRRSEPHFPAQDSVTSNINAVIIIFQHSNPSTKIFSRMQRDHVSANRMIDSPRE